MYWNLNMMQRETIYWERKSPFLCVVCFLNNILLAVRSKSNIVGIQNQNRILSWSLSDILVTVFNTIWTVSNEDQRYPFKHLTRQQIKCCHEKVSVCNLYHLQHIYLNTESIDSILFQYPVLYCAVTLMHIPGSRYSVVQHIICTSTTEFDSAHLRVTNSNMINNCRDKTC